MESSHLPRMLGLPNATAVALTFSAFLLGIVAASPIRKVWQTGTQKAPRKPKELQTDCPFEYILNIYGKHHFAPLVHKLAPDLQAKNPRKWRMILDIMDGVHFCLILIDDITDKSNFRKGYPAAHTIFGASETSHRAYLSLVRVTRQAIDGQPELVPVLVRNLEEILEGQDMSLVWRRDGPSSLPPQHEDRVRAYRKSANLKTGALFRMLGQLIFEDHSQDELMTRVGYVVGTRVFHSKPTLIICSWFSQLQNDCKNVYSNDYAKAKGAFAEDIRNGEFTYPIILGLNQPNGRAVEAALQSRTEADIKKALNVVRSDGVRGVCLKELKLLGSTIHEFVEIWGRKEAMDT
ncbi:MAG: hypothetical protein Q9225_000824 [Loekoesia sp. 1 TL-2023]